MSWELAPGLESMHPPPPLQSNHFHPPPLAPPYPPLLHTFCLLLILPTFKLPPLILQKLYSPTPVQHLSSSALWPLSWPWRTFLPVVVTDTWYNLPGWCVHLTLWHFLSRNIGWYYCWFLLLMKFMSVTRHEMPLVYFRLTNYFHTIFGVSNSYYLIHAILAIQFIFLLFLISTQMTDNTIWSYVQTKLFTNDELRSDEASYYNIPSFV